jgi:hypothetical protein
MRKNREVIKALDNVNRHIAEVYSDYEFEMARMKTSEPHVVHAASYCVDAELHEPDQGFRPSEFVAFLAGAKWFAESGFSDEVFLDMIADLRELGMERQKNGGMK